MPAEQGKKLKKNKNKSVQEFYFRKTIKESGMLEGIGLHSGEKVKMIFHPAEDGFGIRFYNNRAKENKSYVSATVENVIDTSLAVTLGEGNFYVQTIEHLMYAIYVLGITDLIIEIQGATEIPIMDGSAKPFIEFFQTCECHEFSTEIRPLKITKPIMVTDGDRYIVGLPAEKSRISYSINFDHPMLKNLEIDFPYDEEFLTNHISRARTFGFIKEVEYLRAKGLAQGGSTENVLVFTNEGTLNEPRFTHEALYHKILDMIGDLSLVGRPILGHLLGSKGGHALDIAFAKKLITQFGAKEEPYEDTSATL
ncbi:MAG: UDP-3-O-acyl-N-acetylglucosamine deacetylase [Leptospirales bacterium]